MTREARKAIISIAMVITMATSFLIVQPFAQRWGQARVQEIAKTEKPAGIGPKIMTQAVIPQVLFVFGCLGLSLIVGLIVAKKLPPADPAAKRSRRLAWLRKKTNVQH